jgi:hypothetical protein
MSNLNDIEIYIDPRVLLGSAPPPRTNIYSDPTLVSEVALQALRDVRHMLPSEGVDIVDAVLHRAL